MADSVVVVLVCCVRFLQFLFVYIVVNVIVYFVVLFFVVFCCLFAFVLSNPQFLSTC